MQNKDPDILVFVDHYANAILDYLFTRMVKLGLELFLGREKVTVGLLTFLEHPGRHWIKGRLAISDMVARYEPVYNIYNNIHICIDVISPLRARYGFFV